MWITFEDGTYKKYFIWVVDHHSSEVMIAQQDTPDDVNLTYYQLNEDSSKKFIIYLKNYLNEKVMSTRTHDFLHYIYSGNTLQPFSCSIS